jgi:hypothetical protein
MHESLFAIATVVSTVGFFATSSANAANASQVSESPTERMIALNRRAFADIQSQHFQAAKYWLDEALVISETGGLENHEMTARTYVHMAAVSLGGPKDRSDALRCLTLALKINPNIALTPGLEVPGLRSAYLQARQQAGLPPNPDSTAPNFDPALGRTGSPDEDGQVGSKDEGASPNTVQAPPPIAATQSPVRQDYAAALVNEPDLPARVPVPVYCQLPLDLLPGQDLIVRCVTQKQTRRSLASFHYRPDGQETPYLELPMDRTPKGWLVAVLPGERIGERALSYYITAQLPNAERPLYLAYPEAPRAMMVRTDVVADAPERLDSPDMPRPTEPHRRTVDSLWLAVGVGSGVVYHARDSVDSGAKMSGSNKTATVKEGFSPASIIQLEPELGYQITRRLSVSLMGRYQYAPIDGRSPPAGNGEKATTSSAFALFLQGRISFMNVGNLQAFATGAAGFGRSFLAVIDRDCQSGDCSLEHSDTLHGGGASLAAGAGVLYHLSRSFAVFVEAREIATLPKFMALTEFNLGAAVATYLGGASPDRVVAAKQPSPNESTQ